MKSERVPIESVIENPDNPRFIRDRKFKKLCQSIMEFPKMLEIRPIVVDEDMIVLGGNMRLAACKEIGLKEVPIIRTGDMTDEEKKQFVIKDNVPFGEWDWDALANGWEWDELVDWGVDMEDPDSVKQKEIKEAQRKIDEMEIQFNEHHDYIVFVFKNVNDWVSVMTNLKLEKMPDSLSPKAKRIGLGRVLNGERLVEILKI